CLRARLLELGEVEERDREVRAGEGDGRRELERAPERGRRFLVAELLEEGDADVVRAVGGLEGGGGRGGPLGSGGKHGQESTGDPEELACPRVPGREPTEPGRFA